MRNISCSPSPLSLSPSPPPKKKAAGADFLLRCSFMKIQWDIYLASPPQKNGAGADFLLICTFMKIQWAKYLAPPSEKNAAGEDFLLDALLWEYNETYILLPLPPPKRHKAAIGVFEPFPYIVWYSIAVDTIGEKRWCTWWAYPLPPFCLLFVVCCCLHIWWKMMMYLTGLPPAAMYSSRIRTLPVHLNGSVPLSYLPSHLLKLDIGVDICNGSNGDICSGCRVKIYLPTMTPLSPSLLFTIADMALATCSILHIQICPNQAF